MDKNYDVIISGGRCAGATLAIYLAKAGFQVLLVDRATFPSDTLSTNTFFNNTVALLREIGVMDELLKTNVTPVNTIKFQFEDAVIEGAIPEVDGEDTGYCIRRTHLDYILLQHAKSQESITVIEGFRVTDVIHNDETVIGLRGQDRFNRKQEYRASLVVGADGRNSTIRKLVNSKLKMSSPSTAAIYFGYFSEFQHDSVPKFEVYKRNDKVAILFPTNDDVYVVVGNFPLENKSLMASFKEEPENSLRELLTNHFPNTTIGTRLKDAKLVEPIKGLLGYDNYWYQGMGKGWAIVGDAISFKDPAMAQGIHDAICGARILANILIENGCQPNQWDNIAEEYQKSMEAAFMARYYIGCELSKNEPISEEQDAVNKLISVHPSVIEKFLGIYNYANEPADFEKGLFRIMESNK
ncbi:NAD(P)/FAD-dependent oxidoreductase [Peribacillus asahii]|uniref:NAD(P)/FAD-dependent oxidoreductase n=1 Tax=Peribacillus asahii TaxID=228899 RepID=UPI002079BABF|nr:NAD(P)/FAD-dependent oxidoreductase [Peribacillus asahii]USK62344.1 FAD-dependent monooxygenase [Peribacillus asahii]